MYRIVCHFDIRTGSGFHEINGSAARRARPKLRRCITSSMWKSAGNDCQPRWRDDVLSAEEASSFTFQTGDRGSRHQRPLPDRPPTLQAFQSVHSETTSVSTQRLINGSRSYLRCHGVQFRRAKVLYQKTAFCLSGPARRAHYELPAASVGKSCGLGAPAQFAHLFKKMTGLTPLAYRTSRSLVRRGKG